MKEDFLAGRDAPQSSRLREAEELLEAVLAKEPNKLQARTDLGWAYYRANDFARAASAFEGLRGWESVAAKLRSFAADAPYQLSGPWSAVLPFFMTDPLPVVGISVEGRDVYALIDTGGAELILDSEFAAEIGGPLFGFTEGRFAGGRPAPVGHSHIHQVRLGEIEIQHVPVHVLPTRRFSPLTDGRYRLDASMGTNLLAQFRPTLDYRAGRLVLERKEQESRLDGVGVPFITIADHYMVADEGWLNGVGPLKFLVDSGLAGGAFTCPERTLRAAGIPVPATADRGGVGGGGGSVSTGIFTIDELGLGPLGQRDLIGVYIQPAGEEPDERAEHEWDGIISHRFLRQYRWTIDFARAGFIFV